MRTATVEKFAEAEAFYDRFAEELGKFGTTKEVFLGIYQAATSAERREMLAHGRPVQSGELTPFERLEFRDLVHRLAGDIERTGTTVESFCETFAHAPVQQQREIIADLRGQ